MFTSWIGKTTAAAVLMTAALGFGGTAQAQYATPGPEEAAAMAKTPDLFLPDYVLEAAGAYREFIGAASTSQSVFDDGEAVAETVRVGAAYEPRQLARGAVAYAALVALQNPRFHRAVRRAANDPYRRERLAREIERNPIAVTRFDGADEAAGMILAAVGMDGARLKDHGEQVRLASYSVQLQPWSKNEVAEREARLAEAKALSDTPLSASRLELDRLRSAAMGDDPLSLDPTGSVQSYAPVVVRGLSLAALAALGEAGPENQAAVEDLLVEAECAECLRMSKLNLFQCLAVAKPWYEDIYCVGLHGLKDTGACLEASAREPATPGWAFGGRSPALPVSGPPARERWRDGWTRY